MKSNVLSFLFIVLIFASCEKDEAFLYLSISPTPEYEFKNSGELIPFNITIASSATMAEFSVIEIQNNSDVDTLVLKDIEGTKINEYLLYTTPNSTINETSVVKLIFSCKDINGKTASRSVIFYVISSDVPLVGTSGHTMYSSSASISLSAYDLLNGIAVDCHLGISHINDDWPPSTGTTLSRRWTSVDADLDFVKANSFDYANATHVTLQQQWDISEPKRKFVDNIQNDDIILTLIDSTHVVIKIASVIDDIGVENDKYIFSIKK